MSHIGGTSGAARGLLKVDGCVHDAASLCDGVGTYGQGRSGTAGSSGVTTGEGLRARSCQGVSVGRAGSADKKSFGNRGRAKRERSVGTSELGTSTDALLGDKGASDSREGASAESGILSDLVQRASDAGGHGILPSSRFRARLDDAVATDCKGSTNDAALGIKLFAVGRLHGAMAESDPFTYLEPGEQVELW